MSGATQVVHAFADVSYGSHSASLSVRSQSLSIPNETWAEEQVSIDSMDINVNGAPMKFHSPQTRNK